MLFLYLKRREFEIVILGVDSKEVTDKYHGLTRESVTIQLSDFERASYLNET